MDKADIITSEPINTQMHCITLIFSKDRALQLDATLRSFLSHCKDAEKSEIRVLFITSTTIHEKQYEQLKNNFAQSEFLQFIHEQNFYSDAIAESSNRRHCLFH